MKLVFNIISICFLFNFIKAETVKNPDQCIKKDAKKKEKINCSKVKNIRISIEEEENETNKLKIAFEQGDWLVKYARNSVTKIMRKYCQEAYKSYLQDLIMIRLHDLNEITDKTLDKQLGETDHKCKLCLSAIKISNDAYFVQKHGNKFIYRDYNDKK
ncbi:hypothetical protein FZC35_01385 [Candidatus Cytomitobacter indipagum]|uniref:Uncharacterized protein n=1 Tax=Candidatus Cytomitobacter indipagum TaxID=2601575 RepID=A0A5C0UDB1_9PROT|nr:hypothetical protein [Candidatus Cytomitobacter indipagum]QEK38026.1 hypothetical protein FZC35_01385 [Candidatus Cytomitobacter indipagum]